MSIRFYRRVHLMPGIGLNLSRGGPSISLGIRGAHITFGRAGVTRTVGIPGTGIYYTSRTGRHTGLARYRGNKPKRDPWAWIAVALFILWLIGRAQR